MYELTRNIGAFSLLFVVTYVSLSSEFESPHRQSTNIQNDNDVCELIIMYFITQRQHLFNINVTN